MFDNINTAGTKIPKQKVVKGKVQSLTGRPPKPNMTYFKIRIDKTLRDEVREFATKNLQGVSSVINQAIREFIDPKKPV